jgi:rod shape-determining protein MreD
MRLVVCVILGLLVMAAQGLLFHMGVPFWAIPQGLLVCVVFLAFHEFSVAGVVTAFLLGLLLDMSSGVALGPWAGSYIIVYAVFAFLSQRLFVESKIVAMLVVGAATLLAGGVFLALASGNQGLSPDDGITLIGQSAASALVTAPIFGILSRVWRRAGALGAASGSVISAV